MRSRILPLSSILLCCASFAPTVHAQAPYLVKDLIATGSTAPVRDPRALAAADASLYMLAGGMAGSDLDLWRLHDGTLARVGSVGAPLGISTPQMITSGDRAFFVTSAGLWVSDGSATGTILLKTGTGNALARVGGTVFFPVGAANGGIPSLWKTDGTAAGTVLVAPQYSQSLIAVGTRLFFIVVDGGSGGGALWISDGTLAGTNRLGTVSARPGLLTAVGERLFFAGFEDLQIGSDLWASDGTDAGTVRVKDFSGNTEPRQLARVGSTLVFEVGIPEGLWRSDGTEAGTVPLMSGLDVRAVHEAGDVVFFDGEDAASGREIWKTDGTAPGTVRVTDVCPAACSFLTAGGTTFASLPTGVAFLRYGANDLWASDGTAAGTLPLAQFPQLGLARPAHFGGSVYFAAGDGANGNVLWRTDGTAAGTSTVPGLLPDEGSWTRPVAGQGDRVYFTAFTPTRGTGLWTSTGTDGSTIPIDTPPISGEPGFEGLLPIGVLDGSFLFGLPTGLWKTDGSAAGTAFVAQALPFGHPAATTAGSALFGDALSLSPIRSDGTPAGTFAVDSAGAPLYVSPGPNTFASFGEGFALFAHPILGADELFRTDGFPDGTHRVALEPSSTRCSSAIAVEARLFLTCQTSGGASELWVSDGTTSGSRALQPILTSTLVALEGAAYFVSLLEPRELWRSDGTEAGTQPLSALFPIPADLDPRALTASNGVLYFLGRTVAAGRELWRTDGTAAGTFMLRDIEPGPGSAFPAAFYPDATIPEMAAIPAGLIFSAVSSATGSEVWTTDGTAAGTVPVGEIAPGPASSWATYFQPAGRRVFFGADDGARGRELWALDLAPGVASVGDVTVTEGDAGAIAIFTIRLNAPAAAPVAVAYATVAGTAVAGDDFAPASGVLTFAPGAQEAAVEVAVVGDLQDEPDETFTLELSAVGGAAIGDRRGVAVVLDDDAPFARIAADASIAEGDTGTTDAIFPIVLTTRGGGPTASAATVAFQTEDGTATTAAGWPSDFVATSGTLSFPAGTASGSVLHVHVPVRGDTTDEADESFALALMVHGGSAAVDTKPARGRILDDDGAAAAPVVGLAHGTSLRATLAPPPGRADDRDFYVVRQHGRASYEVVVDEVSGDAVPLQLELLGPDGATVLQSGTPVGTGGSVSLRWSKADEEGSFAPDVLLRVRSAACAGACGADDTYRVRAYETTLAAARFNNTGALLTLVLLQNASAEPVSVSCWFWGGFGLGLGSVDFTIAPQGTLALNTATSAPGLSGSMTFTHDGRYGALVGKVVTLDPSTGFTFEAPVASKPR